VTVEISREKLRETRTPSRVPRRILRLLQSAPQRAKKQSAGTKKPDNKTISSPRREILSTSDAGSCIDLALRGVSMASEAHHAA
jgi:hypothetical protein